MPQMMPMMWINMMIFIMITMLTTMPTIYFFNDHTIEYHSSSHFINWNWKW